MAGGIRENLGDDLAENHEINVTPFIDVMLVLLIIFMVAAPLATVDVNVDLPVSNATPAKRPDAPSVRAASSMRGSKPVHIEPTVRTTTEKLKKTMASTTAVVVPSKPRNS